MGPTSVALQPAAPSLQTSTFAAALTHAEAANSALKNAMRSQHCLDSIQQQVHDMPSWSAEHLNVHELMSSWLDRVEPQPLQDIPDSFQTGAAEQYTADELALTPFARCCDPDHTTWMPLPPNQTATPGFQPQTEADLYVDLSEASAIADSFEEKQQTTLESYAALGKDGVRVSKKVAVIPESMRVPPAQGKIYHLTTPVPTLVDFHAPLDTDLHLDFIAHIVNITPPTHKSAPLQHIEHATYPDLELISDLFLGARSKTDMPMHSVFSTW